MGYLVGSQEKGGDESDGLEDEEERREVRDASVMEQGKLSGKNKTNKIELMNIKVI